MRIKPSEGALGPAPSSTRPVTVVPLTNEPKLGPSSVTLSSAVRAFASTFMQGLQRPAGLHVHDILTQADRVMLAWALDFASAQGMPLEELRKLVLDLGAYRLAMLAQPPASTLLPSGQLAMQQPADVTRAFANAIAPSTASPLANASASSTFAASSLASMSGPERALASDPGRLLVLPLLTPPEEALARTILSSLAARDTLIDHAFVRAMLDPDHRPARSVDLAFLRRIVVALSPAHAEGGVDVSAAFVRRDARTALAQALTSLTLSTVELAVEPEQLERGAALLRARLPSVLLRATRASTTTNAGRAETAHTHESLSADPPALEDEPRSGDLATSAIRGARTFGLANAKVDVLDGRATHDAATIDTARTGLVATDEQATPEVEHDLVTPPSPATAEAVPALPLRRELAASGGSWRNFVQLTRDDRALLSLLYVAAEHRGSDLRVVDEVAGALVALRSAEHAETDVARRPEPDLSGAHQAKPSVRPAASPAKSEDEGQRTPARPGHEGSLRAEERGVPTRAMRAEQDRAALPERASARVKPGVEQTTPSVPRSFGSASQMAARCAGTYRSLSGPSAQQAEALVKAQNAQRAESGSAVARAESTATTAQAAPPLDVVHVLGLRPLVEEAHRHERRTRRLKLQRRKRAAVRAIDGVRQITDDPQPDATPFDDPPPRRIFWQLLLQRRMQRRGRSSTP